MEIYLAEHRVLVLGWHGGLKPRETDDAFFGHGLHDGSAVLVRDGRIVAAIEEERLNRVKHSEFFPARAIRHCLAEGGIKLGDLDAIVFDSEESYLDDIVTEERMNNPRERSIGARAWMAETFEREFGADVSGKMRFCKHHLAHHYAARYPSGFPEALSLCIDGSGDGLSGLVAYSLGTQTKILTQFPQTASLGIFYMMMIQMVGYRRFDEYKVMGMAPYGDPATYRSLFDPMVKLMSEGRYVIAPPAVRFELMKQAGITAAIRRSGDEFTRPHMDFAAALQAALERVVLHILTHFRQITGARHLCLSGGVAQNCSMNGRILRSGLFTQVYVQPAAYDAGNSLGAAIKICEEAGVSITTDPIPHLYLGTDIGSGDTVAAQVARWTPVISARRLEDPCATAARLIADGSVIGWVQGRSEFGPRALGNRSILADPRPAANKDRINQMVKKRESYRPFAPSVNEEALHEIFDVPDATHALPFMAMALPVREAYRRRLGAVTHIDGSARVQSVSASHNPRYHRLIAEFGRLTGLPVVLNTSFNNNAEPIVDSIDDAISCALTTEIDHLIIEDWLIEKHRAPPLAGALLALALSVPSNRKLVRRASDGRRHRFALESTTGEFYGERVVTISEALYRLLQDGRDTLALEQRLANACAAEAHALGTEILDLWTRRIVRLGPAEADQSANSQNWRQHG